MLKTNQPGVLIVILNYKTFDLTIKLIEDLRKNLDYDNYSIIVIDNYSTEESAAFLRNKSSELNYIFIANKNNSGYAAGNNIGIRYGIKHGFKYSWILNNDVVIRDGNILKHLISVIEKDAQIACIGPMIYSSKGEICPPYVKRLSLWSMTLGVYFEKSQRQKHLAESGKVYRVYGCCMLLKNKAMNEVDCMDERTFLYGEEDLLAERLLKKGYYSYYDAETSVIHNEASSIKKTNRRKRKQMKETINSLGIYLKEYRKYPAVARWLCYITRIIIISLR